MRGGLSVEDALTEAKRLDEARQVAGFNQVALDEAARQGLGNGAFEDSEEDSGAVVEEFFPPDAMTETQAVSSDGLVRYHLRCWRHFRARCFRLRKMDETSGPCGRRIPGVVTGSSCPTNYPRKDITMSIDIQKFTAEEVTLEKLDTLVMRRESFQVVAVSNIGATVEKIEGRIEKGGLAASSSAPLP